MECASGLVDATVGYGHGAPVLRGVTLLTQPGEVLAVVGPSGSGKTTALRAVAGFERLRGGRALVAGRDVTAVTTPERDLAMVFQATTLVPFLDVAENMAMSVRARGTVTAEEADRRIDDRGRRLRLGRLLTRMPRTLSPGENGLAGIGRAMVRVPSAFLLDEPLAHLDPPVRIRTRQTIVALVRQLGAGALYVTHDQSEAMAVGDRLAVLRDGVVVQVDRPRTVYECPADVFVAGFLGEPAIALLPARLVTGGGDAGYRIGVRTLPLWGPAPAGLRDGDPVLVGLRAEDVHEAGADADPAAVTLRAVVHGVEPHGHHSVLNARLQVAGEADGARLAARLPSHSRLRPGDVAELVVDARRAHVFDPVTGRALLHPTAPTP
ncbi:ABC transporter ATP-binding protein [Pseudonocardia sp. GCM10023141]|uniref:ABC transporter ATP-binding protein n=1 Tax=Pseudonocardia sp. GCM10023141 TaxID=3252653 RepID=UPI00360673BA